MATSWNRAHRLRFTPAFRLCSWTLLGGRGVDISLAPTRAGRRRGRSSPPWASAVSWLCICSPRMSEPWQPRSAGFV
ncbi:uncharacterized protein B0T15DRAFT_544802 [Chaetomium strumarium]|uniref:Uncharacterized protein n=1 Tax=Chaetomium strumarium TaxID=1170767 RepID=A0AAJ0GL12_9PEZI|nr:hypothetical protein B0T15DRAFT_544802 [Chaetomium strumarium]